MSRLNELSEKEIRILAKSACNERLMGIEFCAVLKRVLELAKADKQTEDEPQPKVKVGDRAKTPEGMGTVCIVNKDGSYVVTRLDNGGWWVSLADTPLSEKEEQQPAEDSEEKEADIQVGDLVVAHLGTNVDFLGKAVRVGVPESNERGYKDCIDVENAYGAHAVWPRHKVTKLWDKHYVDFSAYRMELAAKIAIAYAEKGRYEPSEIGAKAVEVANGVIEQLKDNKI